MPHATSVQSIEHELVKLNHLIDRKILRGLSYSQESQRHLQLLTQLRQQQTRKPLHQLLSSFLLF